MAWLLEDRGRIGTGRRCVVVIAREWRTTGGVSSLASCRTTSVDTVDKEDGPGLTTKMMVQGSEGCSERSLQRFILLSNADLRTLHPDTSETLSSFQSCSRAHVGNAIRFSWPFCVRMLLRRCRLRMVARDVTLRGLRIH
jgi:hypothetical protein